MCNPTSKLQTNKRDPQHEDLQHLCTVGHTFSLQLNLALVKRSRFLLPRAFSPEELLVQASQLLEGLESGATSHADAAVSGMINNLLQRLPSLVSHTLRRAFIGGACTTGYYIENIDGSFAAAARIQTRDDSCD